VSGTTQSTGTMTVRNNTDAEVDYYLWPGLTTSQKGSYTYKDWNGNSQWYMVKDASNNWALNSASGGLDSFKAYQSSNSGDTYIDTSNLSGHIRLNYESGSGAETDIYSGSSSSLIAAFLGPTSIKFPGLAASSGVSCLQIDNSGYVTNTGSSCGTGSPSQPSGSAGGDLNGSYPNPTVAKVNGGTVPANAALLGTNSSQQLVAATGSQTVAAIGSAAVTSATSATSFTGALSGDVTGTQGATTVSKINGGLVPVSTVVIGTNSTGQPMSATTTGSGNVVLANSPAISAPTITGTLAGASATLSGTLSVTGSQTLTGATTMQASATLQNGANASQTLAIQPGVSADQIGVVQFNNYLGAAQWQLRKDASNYLRLTDATNLLDRGVFYQNGSTIINAGAGSNAVTVNNTSGSGTGGFIVYEGGSSYSTAALQVTGSGNTTATGFLQGKFMMGTGTMSLAAGPAAGSGPSIACATSHVCDGVNGTATLTTGTSPTTGTLATLSFPNTHTNQANCIVTTLSASGTVTTITWTESTTAITLTANAALATSTTYTVKYWCGGN